jgi:hypothetical protein
MGPLLFSLLFLPFALPAFLAGTSRSHGGRVVVTFDSVEEEAVPFRRGHDGAKRSVKDFTTC